ANGYAVQSLISHVAGGLLVSLCIVLVSVGVARGRVLPDWLGFAGLLPAGLLTATAVQFAIQPTQVETSLSPLALVALALWLVGIGIFLARLRRCRRSPRRPRRAIQLVTPTAIPIPVRVLGTLLRPTNETAQQGEEERAQERHACRPKEPQRGREMDL